ncbi:superfamily II DNA/RNA helicase [Propionicimonas paludicola]|uniref:Superfamily II DNA/RNA helicase n=1 Tax=Propionicimonas paludicola TaxID=185243 RepID=A0A2A9CU51_9ACTN|nr:superfamily II DNA/RNA helicase [Propionicimonas paludicola]
MSHTDSAQTSFVALGVPAVLAESLTKRGIESAFPIQQATLADTLSGRDVLGRGRTGSGKTLAFALPLVARLGGLVDGARRGKARPGAPRGLVLAPTRELANQILETVEPLARIAGLGVMTIFGGVNQSGQVRRLRQGIEIVVATPGRLEDLIKQGHLSLDAIEITILDEADHMADLGFLPGVTRILAATPAGGQRMLFSATLDAGVDKLVKRFLSRPLVHSVDTESSPVAAMTHHALLVADATQKRKVVQVLASGTGRRLLFTRTKHQARKLARELTAEGTPAVELHGNLSQNARERGLKAFADGQVRVLVATDIAARGIHVDDIELVVHVDPPAEHKAYLHRSGRTARAGHAGDVVTLVLPEQRRDFQALTRAAKISVTPTPVSPSDSRLRDLAGPAAALVDPDQAGPAAARRGESSAPQSGGGRPNRQRRGAQPSVGGGRPRGQARGTQPGSGTQRAASGSASTSRKSGRSQAPQRAGSSGGVAAFSRQGARRGGSRRAA